MTDLDPLDELMACLDVLTQFLLHRTQHLGPYPATPVPKVPLAELYSALWQTGELTGLLLQDSAAAWDAVMKLRVMVNELQDKLAEKDLWVPDGPAVK